jgi:uncharacterized repeat protein (TIGR01451 family)
MKPLLRHRSIQTVFIGLALSFGGLGLVPTAQAEGSRTLYPNGATGSRANSEWTNQAYGPSTGPGGNNAIGRRTLLKVYAQAGENILMGSSANGVNNGRIVIYNPGIVTGQIGQETVPTATTSNSFTCPITGTIGRITSRALELNGPQSVSGVNPPPVVAGGGYVPCVFTAPTTGIYDVVMTGPNGLNSSGGTPTAEIDLTSSNNFSNSQGTTIAAWDVTVRSSDTTSTTDIDGRVFTYVMSLFTGGNGRPLNDVRFYPVTNDGYIYRVNTNGLDPNGFIIYGNQLGFLQGDGSGGVAPLYRNILGDGSGGAQMTGLVGNVNFAPPQFVQFFTNPTGSLALTGLGILPPVPPQVTPSSFSFTGSVANNTSLVGTGGTFNFGTNVSGTYEIVISRDGVNFDPTNANNRVLRGVMPTSGSQTVTWNGKDNAGTDFPVGANYPTRLRIKGGEYHFPLIDAENSTNGGPSMTMLNATNPLGNSTAFYDDRAYRTLNGGIVNPPSGTVPTATTPLCGGSPPSTLFSDTINGYNSTSIQRAWGEAGDKGNGTSVCSGNFGNLKGLDVWTFLPSDFVSTPANIVAASAIGVAKSAGTVVQNSDGTYTVPFTITLQNYGGEGLRNVQVTEDLLAAFTPLTAGDISVSVPVVNVVNPGGGFGVTNISSAGTAFTGKGGAANDLLTGGPTSTLAVGAVVRVTFNVTFKPGAVTTTFNNTVVATGSGVSSNTNVTDNSNNGTDPDNTPGGGTTNGDNNPINNTAPTPVNYPNLGIAKTVISSTKKADNSYDIVYSLRLRNYGSESLTGVQVTDDLLTTFSPITASNITIVTAPAVTINTAGTPRPTTATTALTANASFTGLGGTSNTGGVNNLLSSTNVLAVGAEATITVTINVQPGTNTGTYNNTAKGTGVGAISTGVTNDDSQDGTDPDSTPGGPAANNGDANPLNNNAPTPVTFALSVSPNVRLVKRVSAIHVRQPDGTFVRTPITSFNDFLTGPSAADDNAAGWPTTPVYLQGAFDTAQIPAAILPRPGDEVEYIIYFLSDGAADAQNVTLCDFVPNNSSYVLNSFEQAIGTGALTPISDAISGTDPDGFYATVPATGFPSTVCTGTNNGNGAVVVNVGTILRSTGPGTPIASYGLMRFRARVN